MFNLPPVTTMAIFGTIQANGKEFYDRVRRATEDELFSNVIMTDLMDGIRVPGFAIQDGLLTCRGLVYIPDVEALQTTVVKSVHDHRLLGHYGRDKAVELAS